MDAKIRIGRNGSKVHRANNDGNTFCGSQRRGVNRAVTFLPADTEVTCEKCGAEKGTETPAPAARVSSAPQSTCDNGHRIYDQDDFNAHGCSRCIYG